VYVSVRDRPGGSPGPVAGRAGTGVASTVLLLGVVSLLTDVSSEMVAAVLPLYLTAELGLGLLAYGFVDGLYQGVSAVVRILGGYLGDRLGRPKWVAAAGYGLSAASRVALLPAHGFATITSVLAADRLGKGLRTAPRDAMIARASPPDRLGRAFGVHRTLDTVGAALGPLAAFGLLLAVPRGYDSVFVMSFAFALCGLAVLVLLVPDRPATAATNPVSAQTNPAGAETNPAGVETNPGGAQTDPAAASRVTPRELLAALVRPALRRPLLAAALLGLLTVGDGFIYLSLQRRDSFATSVFPLLYVGTNVAYLSLALPLGRLADRIGRGRVLVGGHAALAVAYLVAAAPVTGAVSTVVTLALLGTFYAATDGVLAALTSPLLPGPARGTGLAAMQTVVVLARFGAAVGFGALWLTLGRGAALVLVAALLVAALPVASVLLRPVLDKR
jgi:MFS family permease